MTKRQIERPLLLPFPGFQNNRFHVNLLLIVVCLWFGLPVISVGNITVGGTERQSHVEFFTASAKRFQGCCGTGGTKENQEDLYWLSGNLHTEIGDESFRLKKKFPDIQVAVDNNRIHGIQQLRASTGDIVR
jgi:tetraacyldisaccharide 4'-kinase